MIGIVCFLSYVAVATALLFQRVAVDDPGRHPLEW